MISVTLTVNKLTALSYLSNPKVLENFKIHVVNEVEAEIDGKQFFFSKKVNLQDVEYSFTRKRLLKVESLTLRFSILTRKDGVTITVSGDNKLLRNFNEKKFVEDLVLLETEKMLTSKPIMSLKVKREEITDIINLAITKSINSTLLLWLSSENKFVRMKIRNGEMIEKIGDFTSLGENVDVFLKQLAVT